MCLRKFSIWQLLIIPNLPIVSKRGSTSLKDPQVGWNNGIVISTKNVLLTFDPQNGKKAISGSVFISHAHNDHTKGFDSKNRKIATQETCELYEAKTRKKADNKKVLSYSDKINFDDVEIILHDAGHILGSAQFQIKTPFGTVIYTGDINLLETLTTKSAAITDCDILIMEATYGDPFYAFPDREDTYGNIISWVIRQIRENHIPIFQVYSVGKAQEVIALLNDFTSLPVVVDPPIARASHIYSKYSHKLVFLDSSEEESQELLRHGNCAYLISNANNSPFPMERKVARCMVTGWALRFKTSNGAFPLSSHADYPHLIDYVKEVNPSRVYTCFGSPEVLAQHIRRECKIAARPLPTMEQTSLMNFVQG